MESARSTLYRGNEREEKEGEKEKTSACLNVSVRRALWREVAVKEGEQSRMNKAQLELP